jgi:hypothetical protein
MPSAPVTEEDQRWRRIWQHKPSRRSGSSRTGGSISALRRRDLEKVFRSRWGQTLPPDDAGLEDAELVLHHFTHLARARDRMTEWLRLWAPWLGPPAAEALIDKVLARPRRFRADTLASKINLASVERQALGVTTVGATDKPLAQRIAERREKKRQAEIKRRRSRGAQPRAKFIASTKAKGSRPWEREGLSRATWYRRQNASTTLAA